MALAFARIPVSSHDVFAAFYETNIDAVYSYARHRVGADAAEDVTSEVFHAALIAFRSADDPRMTTAWLLSVTRNKVIDRWRAAARREAKVHLLRPGDHELRGEDSHFDMANEAVLEVLDGLEPRYREILILRYVHGYPVRGIADLRHETASAIESALKRARIAFRRDYTEIAK